MQPQLTGVAAEVQQLNTRSRDWALPLIDSLTMVESAVGMVVMIGSLCSIDKGRINTNVPRVIFKKV